MIEPSTGAPAKSGRRWGDLRIRALSALVMVTVAVLTALYGGAIFVLLWLAASIAVLWEWQTLIGEAPFGGGVLIGAAALILTAIVAASGHVLPAVLIPMLAAAALAMIPGGSGSLWRAGGILYAGALVLPAVALRLSPEEGARSILWLFATVWSTDTFAYFGGRLLGGPKLAPRISPSKTWSGTMTGLTAGTAIGTFAALWGLPASPAVVPIVLLTFLASLLSQIGDAFESALKRRFGVKDSSHLIPGHGGVMDRIDGFVAAAAFAFCVGVARDPHSVASGLFHWS